VVLARPPCLLNVSAVSMRWIFRERPFPPMVIRQARFCSENALGRGSPDDESQEAARPRRKKGPTRRRKPTYPPILESSRKTSSTWVVLLANRQYEHVQDLAKDAVQESGEAIRRNQLAAVATALGLGFPVRPVQTTWLSQFSPHCIRAGWKQTQHGDYWRPAPWL